MAHSEYIVEHSGETAIVVNGSNGWIFRPMQPVEIVRWGFMMTVTHDTTAFILTGNHRQAGSAALTPSGAGDGGTVTSTSTQAAGTGRYTEVVSPRADITTTPFFLAPGEEMQFLSDGGGSSGLAVIWAMYRPMWFQDATLTRAAGTDVLTAPIADVTWLQNFTKVTS